MTSNYSFQLEQYRQDRNICSYLDITTISKLYEKRLADKFDALDGANLTISSTSPAILQFLFPSILRQFSVAECSYNYNLGINKSAAFQSIINGISNASLSPIWPLIVVPASLSILSILFNLSMILVTARKIDCSNMCNWLIAYDSFCQICAVLPFLVNLAGLIANLASIDYRLCLANLMLSTAASYASFLAIYFMSLERLLIVLFPMEMNCFSELTIKICSLTAFGICAIFGMAMALVTFHVRTNIHLFFNSFLYCNTGLYSDVLNTIPCYAVISLAILNYALICFYILWRHYYRRMENSQISSDITGRMLRSVLIITMVLFFGWIVASLERNRITYFGTNIVHFITGKLSNADERTAMNVSTSLITAFFVIATGISAPILFINNFEYRKAYKKTFAKFLCKSSSVGPLMN